MFEHEQVVITSGARSALPIIIAVHSTALGPAAGGCRMWHYPRWERGLDDALRLSAAMTVKCAAAGLSYGGGKTVIAMPEGLRLDPERRRAVLHDAGDLIESFNGGYVSGPDVGTGTEDMATIGERTRHVACRPESAGGSGDASPYTATGVVSAIQATCRHLYGSSDLRGRTVSIVGLGHVGGSLAAALAEGGANLVLADINPDRRPLADTLGARWASPDEAMVAPVDILVPAALGGILTPQLVDRLCCTAIVGPANNQLADESVAEDLARRGICWAPDYVVSAGGVSYATTRELEGATHEAATARVHQIGDTLATILAEADADGITPHRAAQRLAARRLAKEAT